MGAYLDFHPAVRRVPPTSILLYGSDRERLARVASETARRIDAEFQWVEICDPSQSPCSVTTAGRDAAHALLIDHIEELRPSALVGANVLRSMVQAGQDAHLIQDLSAFLQLPGPFQRVLSDLGGQEHPRAVVLANLERTARLYPGKRGDLQPYLDLFVRRGVTPIATFVGAPRADELDFRYTLEGRALSGFGFGAACLRGECSPDCLVKGALAGSSVFCFRTPPARSAVRGGIDGPEVRVPTDSLRALSA